MSWQLGLCVVVAIPLVVLAVCLLWPERAPKDHAFQAIRDRIEGEDR